MSTGWRHSTGRRPGRGRPAAPPRPLSRLTRVISRVDLRGLAPSRADLRDVLPRAETSIELTLEMVRPICADVRERGALAVREATQRYDGVDVPTTRVPGQALADALAGLDPMVRAALEEAA